MIHRRPMAPEIDPARNSGGARTAVGGGSRTIFEGLSKAVDSRLRVPEDLDRPIQPRKRQSGRFGLDRLARPA